MTATVRPLSATDAADLLRFELENRHWFEQNIEPRDEAFYSPAGVQAHIDELLALQAQGRFHPTVIVDAQGHIIGRANLKGIDPERSEAEVGYRISHRHLGLGLASLGARYLKDAAQHQWQLRQLIALVLDNNPASARVLIKNGFVRADAQAGLACIQGKVVDGWRYVCEL